MENFTMSSENSATTIPRDSSSEVWKIAVPVALVLISTAVIVTVGILLFLFVCKKKWHRRSVVAPERASDTMAGRAGEESSKYESQVHVQSSVNTNTTQSLPDNDDQLAITRTQSLTILLPTGKKLSEVFNSEIDTGEFHEPDELHGKQRWQIVQLEPLLCDHHSAISWSDGDDDGVTEITYRQGVYLEWTNTLSSLRSAFIDTHQLDQEELAFCFLWSDVLGEHIDIASESNLQLNKLGRAATRSRTMYIEGVDPAAVQKALCVCGKCALFQCNDCNNRGYCSHDCEQEDHGHILKCSVDVK